MSRPSNILRVARSDDKDQNIAVILHIQPTAATIPLNVSITATDGSDGYGLTLKDSKTRAFKDASSEQSDDDWKAVLRAVLLADASQEDIHLLGNIQLSALVRKDGISVSIREDVGGIRRRLGILQLSPQEVEIELWGWLDRVCKERDEAETRSRQAENAIVETREKLEKLEKQVRELSQAKKKHEDALILQFQHLLNAKKKKIRELSGGQRRMTLPIDTPDKGDEIPKHSTATTAKKRKQADKPSHIKDEEASDEMQLDQDCENDEMDAVGLEEAGDQQTTDDEVTPDDTTDDDDDEEL
ncbi:hypothetical protein H072_791 [Dactylellina haptotyla CBS 200.50]|uniref:Uncharacterized protein n=1 Tax=Dactylellina haptotyla (strain CBS 200.50) TaxID=1284197 RepID=S8AQI3_DACHA|nr:hypothetical protein H072_791 [Dactylellina haptotyla CBS 200.50]